MASPFTPTCLVTAVMLLVSPVTPSSPPPSSSRKRQITPLSEASSPKKITVVTSPNAINTLQNCVHRSIFPNPLGWPASAKEAQIDVRLPLYEPLIPNPLLQAQPQQILPPAQHIILPFDLRVDRLALQKPENRAILTGIFPDNLGISTDGMFVYFHQKKMPPKPWPRTIAGLPPYIAPVIGPQYTPIPPLIPVHPKNGTISQDQNGRDMKDWHPLFHVIRNHFMGLEISITEVIYWGNFVHIVLEHRNTDITKLPWKVANITCYYLYDDEMGRPSTPQARRLTDPTPGNPDNSEYDTLRPGLRVTSNYMPSQPGMFLLTSAGVLVRDQVGKEFMTAASHGFPAECGTRITHPLPAGGRNIGNLIMEVTHTDIALVKLLDTEKFSNVTFQNEIMPEPVQLKRLASVDDHRSGDPVFLDSPDTGCISGTLMRSSYQRGPSDDHGLPDQNWIYTTWYYMGQDSANALPDGICGSAIWCEDGDVIGFFRYAPKSGVMKDWCAGIAADELINRGFTLVDTTNRQA